MGERSQNLRLADIVDAIELIDGEMAEVTLQAFATDMRKRWLVEYYFIWNPVEHFAKSPSILSLSPRGEGTLESAAALILRVLSPLGERDRVRGDFAKCSTGFSITLAGIISAAPMVNAE